MPQPRIHIGTSGWNYASWIGPFYRTGLKSAELLAEYAKTFDTVELNNSFYQLPKPKPAQEWQQNTPADFVFACKAHRYITHRRKLTTPEEGMSYLLPALAPLESKLGPILFQLPPRWQVNLERLESFISALPTSHRYTFELREPSWLCEEAFQILERYGVALCLYDFKGFQSPERVTADFVYVRLHGPNEEAYTGSYDDAALTEYADKIRQWQADGREVYCYFDNDQQACAPRDALRLKELVQNRR